MVQSSWQFYKQLSSNSQLLNDNYGVSLFVVQTQVDSKAILNIRGPFPHPGEKWKICLQKDLCLKSQEIALLSLMVNTAD